MDAFSATGQHGRLNIDQSYRRFISRLEFWNILVPCSPPTQLRDVFLHADTLQFYSRFKVGQ